MVEFDIYIYIYVWYKKQGGGWGGERKKTAMIYYQPQILFLLGARQLRLRSIHLFPFHGSPSSTFPHLSPLPLPIQPPLFRAISQSDWLPPLLSACQHFYTFIHRSLVSIVPEANSFGHNTSRATIILLYCQSIQVQSLRSRIGRWRLKSYCGLMPDSNRRRHGSCKLYTLHEHPSSPSSSSSSSSSNNGDSEDSCRFRVPSSFFHIVDILVCFEIFG